MDLMFSDTGTDVEENNRSCENVENGTQKVLDGVVAYVDVWSGNENMSDIFRKELMRLGATVAKRFSNRVTHVIFKEGNHQTVTRAQKAGIHLLSVLWVDSCKKSHEHVLEKEFPATTPQNINPLFPAKRKRAKKKALLDYDEEKALIAKQLARRHKKQDTLNRLLSGISTPTNSPLAAILVQDTQPRTPESSFRYTPIRLAIPETPPSMREKLRQLRLAKQGASNESATEKLEQELDTEMRHEAMKPLQRMLFLSQSGNIESSPECSPVFPPVNTSQANGVPRDSPNTSITEDILKMAHNINSSLNEQQSQNNKRMFGIDSDENLLSSQEICSIANKENTPLSLNLGSSSKLVNFSDSSSGKTLTEINSGLIPRDPIMGSEEVCLDTSSGKSQEEFLGLHLTAIDVGKCSAEDNSGIVLEKNSQIPFLEEINTSSDGKQSKRSSRAGKYSRPRSTRRFSVHQVVTELDKTASVISQCVQDLEEDPIPPNIRTSATAAGSQGDKGEIAEEGHSVTRNTSNKTSVPDVLFDELGVTECVNRDKESLEEENKAKKSGRRKSIRKSISPINKKKANNRRRSKIVAPHEDSEVGINVNQNNVENKTNEKDYLTATQKRTTKKKLMSLSDLNDQHSVLVEPSKCTQDIDRAVLMESGSKKKRGRQTKASGNKDKPAVSDEVTENQNESDTLHSKECETNAGNGTKRSRKQTGKGKRRKSGLVAQGNDDNTSSAATLVDDTHTELDTSASDASRAQCCLHASACTTQLNLTKDTSTAAESTLSMSMSRAYPNSPVISSLSQTSRKSIDEFSVSQRRKERRQRQMKRFLTSVAENESGSTDSDNSSKRAHYSRALERSGVRKVFRPSIVMTSLHSHEQDVVISVVKKLGGFIIAESVNETTTHVICGDERRTLNVLSCIARGVWLLSKDWVLKSLEAGSWQEELEYECIALFPACKVSRLEREKCCGGFYRQNLFMGLGQLYVSGRSKPPRDKLVQLIKQCGGQVTGCKEKCNIYIGNDYHPGLTCLNTSWIIECISLHQTVPMEKYMLDRPKKESSPEY